MSNPPRTLVELLEARAVERPGHRLYTFLSESGEEAAAVTREGLALRVRGLAAALARLGAAGERVLLLLPPGLAFVEAFFACLYAGAVAVPCEPPRPRRPPHRLRAIAADCRPRFAWTLPGAEPPDLPGVTSLSAETLGDEAAPDGALPAPVAEAVAFLQYTSGSTADPKGVMVRHGDILANEEAIRRAFSTSERSVVAGWLPLFHDMGLIGNVLQPLYCGGSAVLMAPAAFLKRPRLWLETITRYRATTSGGPDFAYDLCSRRIPEAEVAGLDLSSWQVAFNGAEPVRAATLESFARRFAPCGFSSRAFLPCYGLAEATLFVAGAPAGEGARTACFDAAALESGRALPGRAAERSRELVSCGEAAAGTEIAIVEPEGRRRLPDGEIGEIWVAGGSVAAGYWEKPEETVRTFEAILVDGSGDPAGSWLRTGDLGFLDGGELFVAGRQKDLILLRGRNLYPQDLEATASRSHPALAVDGAAAFTVEERAGERLVVAVEGTRRMAEGAAAEVAAAVRQAIAEEHEAAVAEVVLLPPGGVPRTTSGKVRRGACRDALLAGELGELARVALDAAGGDDSVLAPGVGEEEGDAAPAIRELTALAARALGVGAASLAANRPLAAAGLDSLAAIEMAGALERAHGLTVAPEDLLAGLTIADLARLLEEGLKPTPARPPLEPAGPGAGQPFPLSHGQRSLLFFEARQPGASFLHLAGAVRVVAGALDADALAEAFQGLVRRHPALRATFALERSGPVQCVHPGLAPEVVRLAAPADEGDLAAAVAREAGRPFDLERGPLVRLVLAERQGEVAAWALAVHHLVADLKSCEILAAELAALYLEIRGGEPVPPPPALTYADYVRWMDERLAGEEGEALWRFWRGELAGELPVLALPTDRPRPPLQTFAGARVQASLPPPRVEAARRLARERGATLYGVLSSLLSALLSRHSGQDEVLLGASTSVRTGPALQPLVGYFINPLVLRTHPGEAASFPEHVARLQDTLNRALAHRELPLSLLVERLAPPRDPSRPPLFSVFFVFERAGRGSRLGPMALGVPGARLAWAGADLEALPLPVRHAQFDLTWAAAEEEDGGLALALEYNRDLFDEVTASRLLERFARLAATALAEPRAPLAELSLLDDGEIAQLRTPAAAPAVERLHLLFSRQAARTPAAEAVVMGVSSLSYGELERRSNCLARHLRGLGVGPETLVCLALPRSLAQVEAILGVLKAGGAYLPLDPSYPTERLALLLADAGRDGVPPLVVTTAEVAAGLPLEGARAVLLDRDARQIEAQPGEPLDDPGPAGDSLAYVIYTSGSTGVPKGVAVTHGNAVRLFAASEELFGFGPGDSWTLLHSYAFDFSVWEIWGALLYGGRLVVVPREVAKAPEALVELLASERVSVLCQTPKAFEALAGALGEDPWLPLPPLRHVIFGGEALDPASLAPYRARGGTARLINMYGITETTVHVTFREIEDADLTRPSSPIGRPLPDLAVHLLDRHLQPVPGGVLGEICVGGAGVARGYLGRPEITALRFVPDPYGPPGARLYKSGDLARRLPDGDLLYLGRLDHQVKIRGFRIEPGEIEAALTALPEVAAAVVTAQGGRSGAARLVAHVVPRIPGAALDPAHLRQQLAARLPEFMLPSAFVVLPSLPLSPTGKVDRKALPAPGEEGGEGARFVAPRTPTEEKLARLFAELLGVERVGAEDDFFELGGHSLLEAQLAARVRDTFGIEVPAAQLWQTPRLADLARYLDEHAPELAPAPAITPASRDRYRRRAPA